MEESPQQSSQRAARMVRVVLPAYNEAACIGRLLDHIDEDMTEARQGYAVTVVDDGSTDGTAEVVSGRGTRYPVRLMQHAQNKGLGITLRDGLLAAIEEAAPDDVIITMDADDTHNPGLIMRMVHRIHEGHDVIIASRYQPGSQTIGVPGYRLLLSRGGSLLLRMVFPTRGVRDYTCGYRAYRASTMKAALERYGGAFLDQEGFQCMVDILLKLRRMPVIFGEVPFILRYDAKAGASKMRVWRTISRTLGLMLKRRLGK